MIRMKIFKGLHISLIICMSFKNKKITTITQLLKIWTLRDVCLNFSANDYLKNKYYQL